MSRLQELFKPSSTRVSSSSIVDFQPILTSPSSPPSNGNNNGTTVTSKRLSFSASIGTSGTIAEPDDLIRVNISGISYRILKSYVTRHPTTLLALMSQNDFHDARLYC